LYTLTVQQHQFSLDADGTTLFSGALRDYPTLGLATAVYAAPSYLFFGDNSSSGGWSTVDVGRIQWLPLATPVPEPSAWALALTGLLALAAQRAWSARRRQQGLRMVRPSVLKPQPRTSRTSLPNR
jgi:hypothetical protein